jgi:hypothetical protein
MILCTFYHRTVLYVWLGLLGEIRFAKEYGTSILQQAVAKSGNTELFYSIPWGHHILIIEKIKDISIRLWYMDLATIKRNGIANFLSLENKFQEYFCGGFRYFLFCLEYPLPNGRSDFFVEKFFCKRAFLNNYSLHMTTLIDRQM